MKASFFRKTAGFTLIELLITISVLTILLGFTLSLINPARQFAKANNVKRVNDVNNILNAIGQYAADNKGALPAAITTTPQLISNTGADICAALVTKYVASLPVDPLTNNGTPITDCTGAYTTNYTIVKSVTDNRVTVSASATQIPPETSIISATR